MEATTTPYQALSEQAPSRIRWDVMLSFAAFAPCLAYYSFAAVAAIYMGHWPYYAHPDPKNLPDVFMPAYFVAALVQPLWLLAVWPILIVASTRMWRAKKPLQLFAAASPAVLVLLCWVILAWDPHGVLDWFWD